MSKELPGQAAFLVVEPGDDGWLFPKLNPEYVAPLPGESPYTKCLQCGLWRNILGYEFFMSDDEAAGLNATARRIYEESLGSE